MIVTLVAALLTRNKWRDVALDLQKNTAKAQMLGYSLCAMRVQAQHDSVLRSSTEKTAGALPPGTLQRTIAIMMGGGAGTRLFLMKIELAKPAVLLDGIYSIV